MVVLLPIVPGSETTYTVTDPALIAQLSDGEKLPDKIELTYVSTKSYGSYNGRSCSTLHLTHMN